MNKKRIAVWSGIATVVGLGLLVSLRPQAILVETAEATRDHFRVSIEEEGKARVKDRYIVSAPVSGYLRRIEWQTGDKTKQGSKLARLEPLYADAPDARRRAEANARIAAARARVSSADEQVLAVQADADYSSANLKRQKQLFENNMLAQQELEQARTTHQRSQAALQSARFAADVARHELEAAKTLLQYSAGRNQDTTAEEHISITSPINGTILKVYRQSEGVIQAGETLLELGDQRALEIAVDVLSFDATRLKPGTPVEIRRWGGDDLKAAVRNIEPIGFTRISALGVEEQRVWVIADILSPHDQWRNLGDGYRVEAAFITRQDENILQIPASSLFRYQNRWHVYVKESERAIMRAVEIGQRTGLKAEVLDGINKGEQVILHPGNEVTDGGRVRTR